MRNNHSLFLLVVVTVVCILAGCRKEKPETSTSVVPELVPVNAPNFNSDSAYHYISVQVGFGPRIPNSIPHSRCANYLVKKFMDFGAEVVVQEFTREAYDGQELGLKNIVVSFDPVKSRNILLAAHWDTRPFADKDTINPSRPFDGANDGASGVAVLLEIARVLSQNPRPSAGIDIILFDGEDFGEPEFGTGTREIENGTTWWCLGSQYWSKNPHEKNYSAFYGVLLDMVGAKNAKFYKEGISVQYAKKITDRTWNLASAAGFGEYFINATSPAITDDHIFINRDAHIPTISIVDYDPGREDSYFPGYHHTHQDNLEIIDKKTLHAVGQTVLNLIYTE
jgi:hypothetical protein